MKTFSDFKTLQEAREELKKAFKKNAALRATKKELEKKVEKIRQAMLENEEVNKILAKAKYKLLPVLGDKKFLSDIEEEVAEEYKAAKRRAKARVKKGTNQTRNTFTLSDRQSFINGLVKKLNKPVFPVKEIEKALKEVGVTTSPKQFLKALKLPEGCFKRVSKSPKDGSNFHVKASKELAKYLKS